MKNEFNKERVQEIMKRLDVKTKSDILRPLIWERVIYQVGFTYEEMTGNESHRKTFQTRVASEGFVPLRLNGRIKTAFGWYKYSGKHGVAVELSREFFEGSDAVTVMGTVLHEASHYYLHTVGEKFDDGDNNFETLLKKLGAPSSGTEERTDNSKIVVYSCGCGCHWHRLRRSARMRSAMCRKHKKTLTEQVVTYGEYKKMVDSKK